MKVLYIVNSTNMGGATISFLNMVLGLRQKGVTPIVVCPDNCINRDFLQLLEEKGISYYMSSIVSSIIYPAKKHLFMRWLKSCLSLSYKKWISKKKLKKIVEIEKPDIIHTNVGVIHEGYHVARILKIPHVWHLREYQTKDFHWLIFPSYSIFRQHLKKSFVITITNGIREYFKLTFPKAITIYNGIYRRDETCLVKDKESYFLIASRISPEKGILDVIKAFSKFSLRHDYRLRIAGMDSGQYVESLVNSARELDCLDRIDFLGFQKDIRHLMSYAKALIVASPYEGFGRMTAEAAFCGTIVIGRNTAGTKEIMDVTGGLAFSTIDEMTEQMEVLALMPAGEYMSKALYAQKKAKDYYSIENNVDRVFSFYKDIIGQHRESNS